MKYRLNRRKRRIITHGHGVFSDMIKVLSSAADDGKSGARLYCDPSYYAANIFDPDGYSIEAVYKSWQYRQ
jgi:hypothetical protein